MVADRWLPSSKTCLARAAVKPKLPLAAGTYRCDVCALVIDRDTNAAADLAAWGEQQQVDRQHQPGCWLPGRGPPPGRPVSSAC